MAEISVIVPAYNASKTIDSTLKGLVEQTFRNIEIIVVDDGSTDNTGEVVDSWALRDPRIRVIHQDNAGGYAARCAGLKRMDSTFFAFVDADDVVAPTLYEEMHDFATGNGLDVVQCDIAGASTNGRMPELFFGAEEVRKHVSMPLLIAGIDSCYVWDKLYRTSPRCANLVQSNIMMFDDVKLNLQLLANIKSFGFLHKGLYHYQINAGSSVRNFKKRNIDNLREIIAYRRQMSLLYGIESDDAIHDLWIVKNIRNYLITACIATAKNWAERMSNIDAILSIPELAESMQRLVPAKNNDVRFLRLFRALPTPIAVACVRALKALQYIKKEII